MKAYVLVAICTGNNIRLFVKGVGYVVVKFFFNRRQLDLGFAFQHRKKLFDNYKHHQTGEN